MPSTFLCTFLLTLALRASAHVDSPHAFCIFTTHHLQSCDPSTGTPESYLRLNAVLDPESKLAFDVRAERPLSYQNGYKHLEADEEWEIAGVGQGHAVQAGVMRGQQQISMEEASGLKIRLGSGRDEVLFEYGGFSWSERTGYDVYVSMLRSDEQCL
ncbi:hypothetical protein BS50DRAFT_635493 [Corynespora cassiicola Philippines]|uniref:Uncharacterized protein n=1 Tax=Corynespora cassiicola Philippines TaxID=1448308 RepID=A0A2T2NLV0_CORCC|nr:hypothetical protein BS50DRAFT_635493 [Corynespora cassiicola Philippines]